MSAGEGVRLGVVGAGTMGAGVAALAVERGFAVVLLDVDERGLQAGRRHVEEVLAKRVARGRLGADAAAEAGRRLRTTTAGEDLAGCELVLEAVPEVQELKRGVLARAAAAAPGAVLASNTSSIPIGALATGSGAPERVVGLHFFNPPGAMRLVELIATPRAGADAIARARAVAVALGKEVVDVADGPGFVVNRCARPYYLEALRIVEDGVATAAAVDRVCVEDGGFPLGPFELMDMIGIDVSLAVTRSMWEQSFGEPRWRPSPLQVAQVASGRLGRKSGGGFYDAGSGWREQPAPPTALREPLLHRIVAQLVNEAAFAVEAGVAAAGDVDRSMVIGLGHPRGPGAWADRLGRGHVVEVLDALWAREHDQRYRVAPGLRRAADGAAA